MLFWIFLITGTFLRSDLSKRRILIGAFIGSVCYCAVLLCGMIPSVLRLVGGCGIASFILVKYVFNMRWSIEVIRVSSVVIIGMAIFGGVLEIICKYVPIFSRRTDCLIILACMMGQSLNIVILYIRQYQAKEICEVEIVIDNQRKQFVGIFDSGNGLIDPISKKPVSVISKKMSQQIEQLFQKEHFKIIPFSTIGDKKGFMEGYQIEEMILWIGDRKIVIKYPILAIAKEEVSGKKRYDIILHTELI